MLEHRAHPLRNTVGKAPRGTVEGEAAQVLRRGERFGHQLRGVLVAKLREREGAARGRLHRGVEQRARIQPREARARSQVALAVREQRLPGLRQRAADADRGQRVLQRAPAARVHVHVAGGEQRQARGAPQRHRRLEARRIVGAQVALHRDPRVARKAPGHETREVRTGPRAHALSRAQRRGQQREAAAQTVREVRAGDAVLPLPGPAPGAGDQRRQPPVAVTVAGQQHQPLAVVQRQLAAHDEVQPALLRRLVGAHHAGQRALVGDRQRAVAEAARRQHQLLRVRGAGEEAEVAEAVQLGVVRDGGHDG